MTALACLLLAIAGRLSFAALAAWFRPAHQPLCVAAPAYRARHRAEG